MFFGKFSSSVSKISRSKEVDEMQNRYIIITNNPLVPEKIGGTHNVEYKEISYEEVLRTVRDRIHEGHTLLSHPLSGSVKPNETPYKSIMLSAGKGEVDPGSVVIIENAIEACRKFVFKSDKYKPEVYDDFQMIDWTLLESAITSADVM
ncbi:hypothetical protein CLOHYLEM_06524 [[Clostridium] hylemonae DSM 15053]|uniref:GrdX protein n=2 Tax=[Clostridium] hylemonae TaxID=89153 RepID=C0C364_9FIRM|nr:hypothetical protein CLOHYLEM_06524 [[Clostridium] hylemonae DSM 15053]